MKFNFALMGLLCLGFISIYSMQSDERTKSMASSNSNQSEEKTKVGATSEVGTASWIIELRYDFNGVIREYLQAASDIYKLCSQAAIPEIDAILNKCTLTADDVRKVHNIVVVLNQISASTHPENRTWKVINPSTGEKEYRVPGAIVERNVKPYIKKLDDLCYKLREQEVETQKLAAAEALRRKQREDLEDTAKLLGISVEETEKLKEIKEDEFVEIYKISWHPDSNLEEYNGKLSNGDVFHMYRVIKTGHIACLRSPISAITHIPASIELEPRYFAIVQSLFKNKLGKSAKADQNVMPVEEIPYIEAYAIKFAESTAGEEFLVSEYRINETGPIQFSTHVLWNEKSEYAKTVIEAHGLKNNPPRLTAYRNALGEPVAILESGSKKWRFNEQESEALFMILNVKKPRKVITDN